MYTILRRQGSKATKRACSLPPTSTLVSSIYNSLTLPLRLLSTNRELNDLNQDKIEVRLLRIVELSALEAALEE